MLWLIFSMGNEQQMNNEFKILFMALMTHACAWININAQKSVVPRSSADLIPNNSTHIGRITKDSIMVISGTTYSFTVDTPEDSGLVSTNTTVKQLLSQVKSKDGSAQQYLVTDKDGNKKEEGYL